MVAKVKITCARRHFTRSHFLPSRDLIAPLGDQFFPSLRFLSREFAGYCYSNTLTTIKQVFIWVKNAPRYTSSSPSRGP